MMDTIVIILLGISTIIQICDMCGFLPGWIRKRFRINKSQDTLEVLKELGISTNMWLFIRMCGIENRLKAA